MVLTIAGFEFRQRLSRISTYVYFLVFAGLGYLFALMSGGAIGEASVDFGTGGKVLVNSPYALTIIISYVTFFGVVVTGAIAGQATYQDVDSRTTDFFFTAPISKFSYLGGRFLGALAIQVLIFASVGLGAWIATLMPWLDPTRLEPQRFAAYLLPYVLMVLPNLVLLTAIFFGLAALGKKMLPVYAASVILLIGYFVAAQLQGPATPSVWGALTDPFGSNAMDRITRYWTPFQRNTQLIPLTGILLWNRVFWLGVGAALLAITYVKFKFSYAARGGKQKKQVNGAEEEVTLTSAQALPISHPEFSSGNSFRQFFTLTRIQFSETVKNVFFIVLLLAGGLFAMFTANSITNPFATRTYPVTYQMLEQASAGFFIFALAIITFYAGELVWRERDAGLNQIVDALPVQRWVLFASKLVALMLIQVIILFVTMASGILVQIFHNYYRFQLGLYFTDLFGVRLVQFWILCVLALLIHTIVDNKYLGHFVMVLYFIATIAVPALGLQNYLYRFGQSPPYTYSDMNSYGPFAATLFWFHLYWAIAAIALAVVTNLLWVRSTEGSLSTRMKQAAARLSQPTRVGLTVCCLLFLGVGSYIFYNTGILNSYRTTWHDDEDRAQYEKQYQKYLAVPQPKITDVSTQIDLYPDREIADIRGTMMLENKTSTPIDQVFLTVWPLDLAPIPRGHIQINKLELSGGEKVVTRDDKLGFYIYQLPTPLPPQGRISLDFALEYANKGFVNSRPNTDIVANGSFLNSAYIPFIGYEAEIELTDDSTRHKHGLSKAKRMPTLEDTAARNFNGVSTDADWINFEGTVSTAPDQIAILPGYLQKEWVENGRRYFHYKMDAPMLAIASVNSARYAVRRDKWQDVNLEIYYQPGHEFDLDRMMDAMKATLQYASTNFSPFQFHQERIIEFPRYGTFAESFPNTIPYSEAIGFITYVSKDPDAIDIPFYVTAHEVGHQWWAHQVISAQVEGGTSIVETLAQYTALMVMKHRYGDASMQKFLHFEMESYLRGRAVERNEEEPLYKVDENQGYIHYGKGAVVMYALQDYIGEDNVNKGLQELIKEFAFKGPPYPVSLDLIRCLKMYTPPEYQYLYDDMFENITLYDNRAMSATYVAQADGKYQVTLDLDSKKIRADGKGEEHTVPINDWIDVGVQDAQGKYLYLQKQKMDKERTELTLVVDKLPAKAGIDPLNKLIDRNPDDNVVKVEKK
ncbi:MAG TPA: M1 family aminopeptidase [Terriglobales bacterium]|nr:M1 family aminopeptidase [Terriglobales bacterium]